MTRILSVAATTLILALLVGAQADARPGPPGISVDDRPSDQGGVLDVTFVGIACAVGDVIGHRRCEDHGVLGNETDLPA